MALPGFTAGISLEYDNYSFSYGRNPKQSWLNSSRTDDRATSDKVYMSSQMMDETSRVRCLPCRPCNPDTHTQECEIWDRELEIVEVMKGMHT